MPNRGTQPGDTGFRRSKMEANEVMELPILDSCSYGDDIALFSKPYIDQKVDIRDIKPYATNYHLHQVRCRRCGQGYSAGLPQGVTRYTFGAKIKSLISFLTAFYKNSKQEVSCILKDIFNVDISLGSISNSETRVAVKCQSAYQAIEDTIKKSKLAHIDETSHYNGDKRNWAWIMVSPIASLLKLRHSRSRKVLENSRLNPGLVVNDRYAVYNYLLPH